MTGLACLQYVMFSDPDSSYKGSHGGRIACEQLAAILRKCCDNVVKETIKLTPEASYNEKRSGCKPLRL